MDAATTWRAGLARLGLAKGKLATDAARIETLLAWLRLLRKWNRAYNLTAVGAAQMIPRLVLVSAAAAPYLRGDEIVDVGSGAGVPGIPLAVLAPERRYTLLDGNAKKARFLEHCRLSLALENVVVVRARAETYCPRAPFDTIISRACAGLSDFTATTRHLGYDGTLWLALKGSVPTAEFAALARDRRSRGLRCRSRPLRIPDGGAPATLVGIESGAAAGIRQGQL